MNAANIKLIIFDLDGTLVDAYHAVAVSLHYAMDQIGLPRISDDYIRRRVGWGETSLVRSFVPEDKLQETLTHYRQHHAKALVEGGVKYLDGAEDLLMTLKKEGLKMAIASNRPSYFTNIILETMKMKPFFSCVHCADKASAPKPSGNMLKEVLEELAVEFDEALYVGDMTIDIQAGREADVKTVAVTTGSCLKEELEPFGPHAIITGVSALKPIIEELNAVSS